MYQRRLGVHGRCMKRQPVSPAPCLCRFLNRDIECVGLGLTVAGFVSPVFFYFFFRFGGSMVGDAHCRTCAVEMHLHRHCVLGR